MIHISKSILRQTDKEYLAEMSQKKKTEQSETSFQKVLDAEIEKQKYADRGCIYAKSQRTNHRTEN